MEQENIEVNEVNNGSGQTEEARRRLEAQTREIAAAYERAKQEMTEAVARLRAEVEKIDVREAREQAENWVRENPALAAFLALGSGILVGRLFASILTPAPPPPLHVRAQRRASELARHAGGIALAAGGTAAGRASRVGRDLAHHAQELGETVVDRAAHLRDEIADRAAALSEIASARAGHAVADLQESAHGFSKAFQKKTSHGLDVAESALGAARTVVAAVLIKRVNDWLKRLR